MRLTIQYLAEVNMKLKELRGKEKQQDLCEKLNIPVKNLSNYETGRTQPNIETLIKLADYFNVSLDYLCDRPWNNQIGYIPDDKRELVKLVLKLNELNTMRAISYISGMLAIQNN